MLRRLSSSRSEIKYKRFGTKDVKSNSLPRLLSISSTALANFTAQYNFQSIAIALIVMSSSECTLNSNNCDDGSQKSWVKGTANAVIFVGAVIGQLSMGFLGDYLSRNSALAVTLSISAISALFSAILPYGNPTTIYSIVLSCRFFIGIGLGGIYPLSATKASEDIILNSTSTSSSSINVGIAFLWQIPGLIVPWLLALLLTYTTISTNIRWRLILGIGCIPSILAILCLLGQNYYTNSTIQSTIKPTSTNRIESIKPIDTDGLLSIKPVDKIESNLYTQLCNPIVRTQLLVCGGTWLLYDIVFYGLALLGSVVIDNMSINETNMNISSNHNIRLVCIQQVVVYTMCLLPMLFTIYLLHIYTLKYLQILGFIVEGLLLLLFVSLFSYLKEHNSTGLFILYCLALMSLQLGVPVTTYALPASVFDKDIRCTFNGIASAMGKIGAIIGAYSFYYIAKESIHAVLIICVIVSLIGAVVTYYYLPDAYLCNKDTRRQERCTTSMTLLEATLSGHDEEMLLQSALSWNTWDSTSGNSENNDSSSIVYNKVHNNSSSTGSINTSNEYNNSFVVEL